MIQRPKWACPAFLLLIVASVVGCHESAQSFGDVLSAEIVDVASGRSDGVDSQATSIVATPAIQRQLNELRDAAIKDFPSGKWVNYGPDSSFRSIRIVCRHGDIELDSWHPTAEDQPDVVAASHGLTSLRGRSREEVLQEDDQNYVRQREAFDSIEDHLRLLGHEE